MRLMFQEGDKQHRRTNKAVNESDPPAVTTRKQVRAMLLSLDTKQHLDDQQTCQEPVR